MVLRPFVLHHYTLIILTVQFTLLACTSAIKSDVGDDEGAYRPTDDAVKNVNYGRVAQGS